MPDMSARTVVDLSTGVAGQFCARLFADHGADVVLVEPPGGCALRSRPGLFEHLNRGKRSISTHDPELAALLAHADVVIVGLDAPADAALPSEDDAVICVITDFGTSGPRAAWVGSELIHQSLSGLAFSTGAPGRAPLFGFGQRAYYSAGAAAYAAGVAALIERDRSGLGQRVETTVVETAASMSLNLVAQYDYNATFPLRGEYPGPLGVYECADGWVALFVLPGRWTGLCLALGLDEHAHDERFTSGATLSRNWPAGSEILRAGLRTQRREDVVERGQQARVAVSSVLDVGDVVDSSPAEVREYWSSASAPPLPTGRSAGAVGVIAPSPAGRHSPGAQDRRRPLEGLRVLDLTTAWAGPMTGRSLAHFGAEVIKIESRASIDAWRGAVLGGDIRRYPDLEPGERPYNRSCWFNTQNHDKLGVELDLKNPAGREVISRLVAVSDVVICNLAPGALARLGLDYDSLRGMRDDIILMEITGFESDGPMSRQGGVGPTIEASTGMMSLIGYGDGEPYNTGGAYLDPIGAYMGTGLVLTALAERNSSGRGQRLELSLRATALQWMGEYLVEYCASGEVPHAQANGLNGCYPHDIFAAAGMDEWIAVGVTDDAQWPSLCAVIGRPDLAGDPHLATAEGRLREREALDKVLHEYFAGQDRFSTATRLQELGVPAAPVCSGADVGDDPQLEALGFVYTLAHPDARNHRYQGLPYHLGATPGRVLQPAPCLGQDTDHVLRRIARLDDDEIARLYKAGAAVADPRHLREYAAPVGGSP